MKTPEQPSITKNEKGEIVEERVKSDAALIEGGTRFKVDENDNISMELTDKQEAIIKDEMKLEKSGESLDELMNELARLSLGDEEKAKQLAEKINLKNLSTETKLTLYEASDNNYYIAEAIIDDLKLDQQLKLLRNVNARYGHWHLAKRLFDLIEEKGGSAIDTVKVVATMSLYSMNPSDAHSLAERIPWDNLSNVDKIAAINSIGQYAQREMAEKHINWNNLNPEELIEGFKRSFRTDSELNTYVLSHVTSREIKDWKKFTSEQLNELKKLSGSDDLSRKLEEVIE